MQHVNLMFPFLSGGLLAFGVSVCFAAKIEVSFVAISKHNPALNGLGVKISLSSPYVYRAHKALLKTRVKGS